MNPRCPTVTLTAAEGAALRTIVETRGEKGAVRLVGVCIPTLYKAAGGFPVSRLTAQVIRGSLDRI
jgi:hypothetical protein